MLGRRYRWLVPNSLQGQAVRSAPPQEHMASCWYWGHKLRRKRDGCADAGRYIWFRNGSWCWIARHASTNRSIAADDVATNDAAATNDVTTDGATYDAVADDVIAYDAAADDGRSDDAVEPCSVTAIIDVTLAAATITSCTEVTAWTREAIDGVLVATAAAWRIKEAAWCLTARVGRLENRDGEGVG